MLEYPNGIGSGLKHHVLWVQVPLRVLNRDVAQFDRAPGLGPGGRRLESCHPDHFVSVTQLVE